MALLCMPHLIAASSPISSDLLNGRVYYGHDAGHCWKIEVGVSVWHVDHASCGCTRSTCRSCSYSTCSGAWVYDTGSYSHTSNGVQRYTDGAGGRSATVTSYAASWVEINAGVYSSGDISVTEPSSLSYEIEIYVDPTFIGTAPPPPPSRFTIVSGGQFCEVTNGGLCITDGAGNYGDNEACAVRADVTMTVTATEFGVESHSRCEHDALTINWRKYCGSAGPQGVTMEAGSTMTWSSDYSNGGVGFVVCSVPVGMMEKITVSVSVTASGTVSDYAPGSSAATTIKTNIATTAGVSPSDVSLTVTAASVNIRCDISVADAAAAESATSAVTTATSDMTKASTLLGITVESVPVVETKVEIVNMPPPPPPLPLPPPLPSPSPPPSSLPGSTSFPAPGVAVPVGEHFFFLH